MQNDTRTICETGGQWFWVILPINYLVQGDSHLSIYIQKRKCTASWHLFSV